MSGNSVQTLSAHSEQPSLQQIFIDGHSHKHPDLVEEISEAIVNNFPQTVAELGEYRLSLQKLIAEHQELLNKSAQEVELLQATIAQNNIDYLVLEFAGEDLEKIFFELDTIKKIVNAVFSHVSTPEKDKLTKDLLLLSSSPGVYLQYQNLIPNTKIIPGEDKALYDKSFELMQDAKVKRSLFLKHAKETKKVTSRDIDEIDQYITDFLSNQNFLDIYYKQDQLLFKFAFDTELYRAGKEWLGSHADFLRTSNERDQHLSDVIRSLSGNILLSYGKNHIPGVYRRLKKRDIEAKFCDIRGREYGPLINIPRLPDANEEKMIKDLYKTLKIKKGSLKDQRIAAREEQKKLDLSVEDLLKFYEFFCEKENIFSKYRFSDADLEKQLKTVLRLEIEKSITDLGKK